MTVTLIIEKADKGFLGRIKFRKDLIVAEGATTNDLENKISNLLRKTSSLNEEGLIFKHRYDLSALFEKFDFLKISNVAKMAGINESLLRQYVTGNKHASLAQAKKIENALRNIGKGLSKIQIHS